MDSFELFNWWAAEHAIAHPPSAWQAWSHKDREIVLLRARLMQLQEQNEHLEQRLYEASRRNLRLVHSAA